MTRLLYIAALGVLGVFSRYFVGVLFGRFYAASFPMATMTINVVGSFLIGVIYVLGLEHAFITEDVRIAIMVGFLGGFTTFSSYSLESARLLESGEWPKAAAYFVLSPMLGLAAVLGGLALTRLFLRA